MQSSIDNVTETEKGTNSKRSQCWSGDGLCSQEFIAFVISSLAYISSQAFSTAVLNQLDLTVTTLTAQPQGLDAVRC